MKNRCRTAFALFALSLFGAAGVAGAQAYPDRSIRLVVPFAPGGGTDLTARAIAQKLSEALGKPVMVDNRGGAGGVIGADLVAKAAPDGYTLVMGTPGSMTINPNLRKNMPYDTLRDFAPITQTTISPFILVVHPSLPVSTVKGLIALAKRRPGAINFGTAGNGSVAHLAAEQFKAMTGVQITHVPYKGSSQSLIDLLAGQVQMVFENLPVVLPHIRAGKLRVLAVGTRTRSALLPEYPTVAEAGVPGYEASTAFGMLAPAKTPKEIIGRLNREVVKILRSAEIKASFGALGLEPVGGTPEQYAEHLRAELARYAKVIKTAGIRIE
ncbi:MAG: tripartite tricarboxylate transporter substrate binding protein [Betaproteobacteria bacterium]|nr:tripartite tricarboxylate transporter substrate binding protein [Betaproteobacteria bacterium]